MIDDMQTKALNTFSMEWEKRERLLQMKQAGKKMEPADWVQLAVAELKVRRAASVVELEFNCPSNCEP